MSRPRTLRNIAIWLSFFTNVALGTAQDATPSTNSGPVLFVNQQPVSAEEFVWFMQQERPVVLQFVKAKFNLDYGTNFWDRVLPNLTPRALLRQRTVGRIVREKVQQLLFRDLGLVEDIGYPTFVKNLEKLNDERDLAARHGQIIYGPVRYTQLQYYTHWMAGLRLRATEQLAQRRWNLSDAQMKRFYAENKEKFYVGKTSTLETVTVGAGQTEDAEASGRIVQITAEKIVSAVERGADMKTTAEEYQGDIKATWRRFDEINDSRIGELFTDDKQLAKILRLSPGQSVLLPVSRIEIQIARCISKTPEHYPAFEEIKSRVKSLYLDDLYDRMIEESVTKASIQVEEKTVESFCQ